MTAAVNTSERVGYNCLLPSVRAIMETIQLNKWNMNLNMAASSKLPSRPQPLFYTRDWSWINTAGQLSCIVLIEAECSAVKLVVMGERTSCDFSSSNSCCVSGQKLKNLELLPQHTF